MRSVAESYGGMMTHGIGTLRECLDWERGYVDILGAGENVVSADYQSIHGHA